MTQQQVADELGSGQSVISELESIGENCDNVTVKSDIHKSQSSQRGNAKSWTIALGGN
jgi:hypothetical protein